MENQTNFILNACAIKGDGSCDLLDSASVSKTLKDDALGWVHLDGNKPETRTWLSENIFYLDNLIIDALLVEETRPRIIEFEKGALLILRGVNLNENSNPEDMVSIRLWIDANRIISVQRRPLKATKDIQEKLLEGNGPKNSGDFIAALSARLFERMEPIFQDLDEKLDDIEEKVIEKPEINERQAITIIRKKAILFRRYISPQRDVIAHLRTSEMPWIDATHKRRLQESLDRVTRYIEDLDTIRERSQIVKEELASILSDKMNSNLYMLSLVAAIFLPLGFFTGLLGINIGGIPGSENPNAFLIFCGILIIIVALQIVIFKKLKWL